MLHSDARARRPRSLLWLLFVPAAVVFAAAFLIPLAGVLWRSFSEPELGLHNYISILTDGVSMTIIGRTIGVSLLVALVTLIFGYPFAYAMAKVSPVVRALLITIVLVPFWTSMMARNFAWLVLLQKGGPVQELFAFFGIDGVVLFGTTAGVVIAMSQVLLPFMVLPLYTTISSIDSRLLLAAESLGSSKIKAFWKVYWPLSRVGVLSGSMLVFVVAFGFYVTPAIIGSPQQSLVAQLLSVKTNQMLDFGGAGALGILTLAITLALMIIITRLGGSISPMGVQKKKEEVRR